MPTKQIIRALLIGIPALLLLLIAAGLVFIDTPYFRNFIISEIQTQALLHAGARVQIAHIEPRWTQLDLDLDDVSVFSAASLGSRQPPFLQARRIEISVPFGPLLRGSLHLRKLILDQPIVKLVVDAQGRSNLPIPPPSRTPSRGIAPLFDLEIGDCAIHSGDVYYQDAEIPLNGELHHLTIQAGYSLVSGHYVGSLSYDEGRLALRGIAPVSHSMNAKFSVDRSGLSLSPLLLDSENSRLALNARLNNFTSPSIDGTYQGAIETSDIARAFRLPSLPLGNVSLNGSLTYPSGSKHSFLNAIALSGQIKSARLRILSAQRPFDVTDLAAAFDLRNASLEVTNLRAVALGGTVQGTWKMQNLGAKAAASHFDASIRGVSIASASNALAPANVRQIPLTGILSLDTRASWSGSISNATVHIRLTVSRKQLNSASQTIPLNGFAVVDYDGPRDTLSFSQSHLQTSQTQISITGSLHPNRGNSVLAVKAATANLAEVTSLASLVRSVIKPAAQMSSKIPALAGSAALTATITGTVKNPRMQAHLTAQNLQVDGSSWRALSLDATAMPNEISIQNGALVGNRREEIHFAGNAGLAKWSLRPASPVSLQASMSNMPITEVREISGLKYPVTGTLSDNISVHGTRQAPQGTASITLASGTAWEEPLQSLIINVQSSGGTIHTTLELRCPAGTIASTASYELNTQQYVLALKSGDINLAKLAILQKRSHVQGIATISVSGHGSFRDPQLTAEFNLPKFSVQGHSFSKVEARASVANQHANLELQAAAPQGSIEAKGDVVLSGDHYASATVDVRSVPTTAVLAMFLPSLPQTIGGQMELHGTVTGPLSMPTQMEAHLQIPSLNVSYEHDQIALTRPLQADYRGGMLTVSQTHIQGMGTDITFGGRIPITHEAPYSLSADGAVDLSALNKFAPDFRSSGQVLIHLHSEGRSVRPNIEGQLLLKNAVLTAESSPIGLEGVNAQLNISGNRADIVNFSGAAGGGSVSARGFAYFGHDPTFNLVLNAQSVRIRYPQGLRLVLSGQVALVGRLADSSATGRVLIDNLSFTQQFDLAAFVNNFSNDSESASSPSFEKNMKLRVVVLSAQNLNLASRENGLSIGGSANLNVLGTLADPVLLGRVELSSGEIFYLGKRFDVQSGAIEFANPARTEPVLRLAVHTTIEQYDITMNLTGPADRLRTSYTSVPALAPADIIHLLAFGNTNAEASSQQQSASLGAESVLASQVSGQVAGKIESLTGISQLTIDPLATNTQGSVGAQIGIQERVTGSLLFTFSTDVTTTQGQTVELQYELNKLWSVIGLRDQNGGYGLNLRFHKAF